MGKLNKALSNILSRKDTSLDLRNMKYLPRWAVLLIDISLVAISTFLTVLIVVDLTPNYYTLINFYDKAFIIVLVHILYFYIFKTYAGIIRYSSNIDALKLLLATASSFFSLLFINYTTFLFFGEKIFLAGGLLINLWITFSLLFLFRLGVKQVYEYFKLAQKNEQLINAVIIGADENAISVAGALDHEHPRRFKIVGFLSQQSHNKSIRLLDKPVIQHLGKVHHSVEALGAEAVVLSEHKLSAEEKYGIVKDCLENDIKVYNAPIVSSWGQGQPIAQKVKSLQIEDLLEREPIKLDVQNKIEQLTGKTILVTGGAGSIGSEIVRQVADYNPKKLIVLDQAETPLHSLRLEIDSKFPELNCKFIICDVGNIKRLELMFQNQDIDVVYHAAAYKHVPLMEENPHEAVFVNIAGTKNLADLSVKYKVGHFVMVSTDKAVNPSNVMGASKRAAEMYVQSLFHGRSDDGKFTRFITTRFGNVLGSNGSVVPLFKKQIEKGGPVTITHPDIIRYFMTIPEACQLVLEAGAMGKGGEIFIFDMGEPVKIMDLAIKMIKLAGYDPNTNIKVKITGLRPGEKLYEELLNDECKTLPTHHKKIMIGQDVVKDFDYVNNKIENIILSANELKADEVVLKLKDLIPEFKSNNSSFERLDKKEKLSDKN